MGVVVVRGGGVAAAATTVQAVLIVTFDLAFHAVTTNEWAPAETPEKLEGLEQEPAVPMSSEHHTWPVPWVVQAIVADVEEVLASGTDVKASLMLGAVLRVERLRAVLPDVLRSRVSGARSGRA